MKDVKKIILISLFAILTGVGALVLVPIPISPVPITLQTMFCILSGLLLGKKTGFLSQLFYVFLGVVGLPVFSRGSSGIAVLMGPTGGYILSFPIASYFAGYFSSKGRPVYAVLFSTLLIFIIGLIQLKFVLDINFMKAVGLGFVPFIPGAILKAVLAFSVYKALLKNGVLENIVRASK